MQINKLKFARAISSLTGYAEEVCGVSICYSDDIAELDLAQKSVGKEVVGEHFRMSLTTLPPNRMFWLAAMKNGEVAGTVAARCDNCAWNLQKFIKSYWERAYCGEEIGAEVQLAEGSPEVASQYSGVFAYLGEGYVREDMRNNHLSCVLVRLAILLAYDEWRPEIAYGWMRDRQAYRGLSVRWGFNHCVPSALSWVSQPKEKDWNNLAFLACDAVGFHQLMFDPLPEGLFHAKKNNQVKI